MNRFSAVLLLAAALLAGCGGASYLPTPTATAAVTPAPVSTTITLIPTPTGSKSTVTGILMTNQSAPVPAVRIILYLGAVLTEAQGTPFVTSFDRTNSPQAVTDANGRFVFADVDAGRYTLILDRVVEAFLLGNPNGTPGDFYIEAQGGQVVDLGKLIYATLPSRGQ